MTQPVTPVPSLIGTRVTAPDYRADGTIYVSARVTAEIPAGDGYPDAVQLVCADGATMYRRVSDLHL